MFFWTPPLVKSVALKLMTTLTFVPGSSTLAKKDDEAPTTSKTEKNMLFFSGC